MPERLELARNWLPRYTGMRLDEFGDYVLLTNFRYYLTAFAETFGCDISGENKPMQAATNDDGLTIINFGIGSANAATIMDLLSARQPKGVLFLGKCGGLKQSTDIGHFILPIAAVRGEGTSNDYFPPEVPALPSFKLHKFVSQKIAEHGYDYRTGVGYTTNRRVWEHDQAFVARLKALTWHRHRHGDRHDLHRWSSERDCARRALGGVRPADNARRHHDGGVGHAYHRALVPDPSSDRHRGDDGD